jgi:hypothetical protein
VAHWYSALDSKTVEIRYRMRPLQGRCYERSAQQMEMEMPDAGGKGRSGQAEV